jgi:hypothetical protein
MLGKRVSKLKQGDLLHEYTLLSRNLYVHTSYDNKNLQGLSLKATVSKVEGNGVWLSIWEDENKKQSGNCSFFYATVYATPDGRGWYCMPEAGDEIRLTFPDYCEKEAYAASSIHMQSSESRSNPDEKSWKNIYEKEIRLTPNTILLTNHDGMSVELSDEDGIHIKSKEEVTIHSKQSLHMSGAGIAVEAGLGGISLTQEQANITIREKIQMQGRKVLTN